MKGFENPSRGRCHGNHSSAGATDAERINYEEEGGQRVPPEMLETLQQGIESAQGHAGLQIKLGRRQPQERFHKFLLTSSNCQTVDLTVVFATLKVWCS